MRYLKNHIAIDCDPSPRIDSLLREQGYITQDEIVAFERRQRSYERIEAMKARLAEKAEMERELCKD